MNLKLRIKTPEDMENLGYQIGLLCVPKMVLAMNGNLGAGKTTMTKGLGKALGIKRVINSPTFTIMKVYDGILPLYHLDVYRIENSQTDFELEEYFDLDGVSVVEWADNVAELLPSDAIKLNFIIENSGDRIVEITSDNQEFMYNLKKKVDEYQC